VAVSRRERRNRKDRDGKTPEQIRRGQQAHELAYEEAVKDQQTMGIRPGAMGAAWRVLLDEVWWRGEEPPREEP
jgi:hypothetical protein